MNSREAAYLHHIEEGRDSFRRQRNDLLILLKGGEDIISGLEAAADNAGVDLAEVRGWWTMARKLIDKIENEIPS